MCAAPVLLADVGGTNTRFAMSVQGRVQDSSFQRYANADLASFEEGAKRFLAAWDGPRPESLCVAIAGPVAGGVGKLTNGAWRFDPATLQSQLDMPLVHVINDLAALGYALPDLPSGAVQHISDGDVGNGQSLVVGVATGFNVSLSSNVAVFQAEQGHAGLSQRVLQVLREKLGAAADDFETVEHCFSGAGLAHMHLHLSGSSLMPAEITGADTPETQTTKQLFARALGVQCRELIYQYLPLSGLYFNGTLARAILGSDLAQIVVEEAGNDHAFAGRFGQIPISLITQDSAPLYGCARFMSGR